MNFSVRSSAPPSRQVTKRIALGSGLMTIGRQAGDDPAARYVLAAQRICASVAERRYPGSASNIVPYAGHAC